MDAGATFGRARTRDVLAALLIAAVVVAAYSNCFNASFHFDDFHQITENHNVRRLADMPRFFVDGQMESSTPGQKGYRPLTLISFTLNYAVSGYNPWSYHLVNVVLHIVNAILVFMIVARILGPEGRRAAIAVSLLFAAHPLQTNAVTYISGRSVLLASSFYLASFYSFLRFRSGGRGAPREISWGAAALFFFIAALLSKEMSVSLIFVMAAYDIVFGAGKGRGRVWPYYFCLLAALLAFVAVKRAVGGFWVNSDMQLTVAQYLMSEAKALLLYLRLLVLPVNLNADYNFPGTTEADLAVVVSALTVALTAAVLIRLRKGYPAVSFFGFWFLLALAPESSLVPINDVAVEYRLYLPSVGFIAAVAAAAWASFGQPFRKAPAVAACVLLFGALTFCRNGVWATETTLWRDAAAKSPNSARSRANYGGALLVDGRYPEALSELNRSIDINPFYEESCNVFNNIGVCLYKMGECGEALSEFERSVKVNPGYVDGYSNMGAALRDSGRLRESLDALQKAAAIDPSSRLVREGLAKTFDRMGRPGDAARERALAEGLKE